MKKLITGILVSILVASAAQASTCGEQLGFDILKDSHQKGKNCIISSLSLAQALGMAAEGAKGDTLSEILYAMDAADTGEIAMGVPDGISCANAVFCAQDTVLLEEYRNAVQESYQAEIFPVEADFAGRVNAWAKEKTNGLIDSILPEDPSPDMKLVLINAIAMKSRWVSEFDPEFTWEGTFRTANGDVEADMMHQTEYFAYSEKDDVQIIRLPYTDGGLEMWVLLPREDTADRVLEQLAAGGMEWVTSDCTYQEIALTLPKFDLSDSNELSDALMKHGISAMFGNADFSGISENTDLVVSSVLQKTRVKVDEGGTEAAAVTTIIMEAAACPGEEYTPPIQMRVDHPFVFVISDSETGAVCFAGVVEDPAAN